METISCAMRLLLCTSLIRRVVLSFTRAVFNFVSRAGEPKTRDIIYYVVLTLLGRTATAKTTVLPTVKFPGGYNVNDKGIYTPNIFNFGFKYTFPGPAIAKFSYTGVAAAANAETSSTSASAKVSTTSVVINTPSFTTSATGASTAKAHTVCRRSKAAVRGWNSRMEKRYVGAPEQ